MKALDSIYLSHLPRAEDFLSDPLFAEVQRHIAAAEALLARDPAGNGVFRHNEYRATHEEIQTAHSYLYGNRNAERRHLEPFQEKVRQRKFNWLFGNLRQSAIWSRHDEVSKRKHKAYEDAVQALREQYPAEAEIDEAIRKIGHITYNLTWGIQEKFLAQVPGEANAINILCNQTWLRRSLSAMIWRHVGLTKYQENDQLIDPSFVRTVMVFGGNTGSSTTKRYIDTDPNYEDLLQDFDINEWHFRKAVIGHVFGAGRLAEIEQVLQDAIETHISKHFFGYDSRFENKYGLALAFLGSKRTFDLLQQTLHPVGLIAYSVKDLINDVRLAHAWGTDFASAAENHLTGAIISVRARKFNNPAEVEVNHQYGVDAGLWANSQACLELLNELAPEKGEELAAYKPVEAVYEMAREIATTPLAALRKIPGEEKVRALLLLDHYKFAPVPAVSNQILSAITALSFATPLEPERIAQLEEIAEAFLDAVDMGEILRLAPLWSTMALADMEAPVAAWHDKISEIIGLPNKRIELIDSDQYEGSSLGSRPQLGGHKHNGPIQVAARQALPEVIATIVHETLHQLHVLIETHSRSAPTQLIAALFHAQRFTRQLDFRPPAGMDITPETERNFSQAVYLARVLERESSHLDRYVEERLKLRMDLLAQGSDAAYLAYGSATREVPLGKLLALIDSPKKIEPAIEKIVELRMLLNERPIFDLSVTNGAVCVEPFAVNNVQAHPLTAHHLQAMGRLGEEVVKVRLPKAQLVEFEALMDVVASYPLPRPAEPPRIPTTDDVFGLPSRNPGRTGPRFALPAPAQT